MTMNAHDLTDSLFRRLLAAASPEWLDRFLWKQNRLEKINTVALRVLVSDAVSLYGPALSSQPCDEFPRATRHIFHASPYHRVLIWEWNEAIHSVTYKCSHAAPARDLKYMQKQYGQGHSWVEFEQGYRYHREDGSVRLWCSAMPAIGVATDEYLDAKESYLREAKEAAQKFPFDVTALPAITTRQVMEDGLPILSVVHYDYDQWAFVCGTTDAEADDRHVPIEIMLHIDPTLTSISDLPPGNWAYRSAVGEPWTREPYDAEGEEAEQD
ncbi:MAG: hypothetical protein GY854_28000 [Deltaproteobacteria bacterium]|nr:hypothetical protein [Deltaproteobacteria bacterium]